MREISTTTAPIGREGRRVRVDGRPRIAGPGGLLRLLHLGLAGAVLLTPAGCGEDAGGGTAGASEGMASDAVPSSEAGSSRAVTPSPSAGKGASAAPGADAAGEGFRLDSTTLRIAGVEVIVEIADEPAERKRGLMHRDSLPADHGMLFVYPSEGVRSFWMRDTSIPLSIAFIDSRGYIVEIQQMSPHSDRFHESPGRVLYALEMPGGWFAEHGVEVGDRISF